MPARTITDECGKFKWIDHEGRVYQSTPFAVEPDATAKTVFIANMMHAHLQHPVLSEKTDVTCPADVQDNERRKEVVHHEEVPGCSKPKKSTPLTKKSNFTTKAKSIPATPKTVAASTGSTKNSYCLSIKRSRSFAEYGDQWRRSSLGHQMEDPRKVASTMPNNFVLKSLTQAQQSMMKRIETTSTRTDW